MPCSTCTRLPNMYTRPKTSLVVQLQGFNHTLRQICLTKFIFSYFYLSHPKACCSDPLLRTTCVLRRPLNQKGVLRTIQNYPPCQLGPKDGPLFLELDSTLRIDGLLDFSNAANWFSKRIFVLDLLDLVHCAWKSLKGNNSSMKNLP